MVLSLLFSDANIPLSLCRENTIRLSECTHLHQEAESTALDDEMIPVNQLIYSDKYVDEQYEYRHVIIPKQYVKYVNKTQLMTETEWRNLGIAQSPGWIHYMIHTPEPHVLMFRKLRSDLADNKENSKLH